MKNLRNNDLSDRRNGSANAKKALLENFRAAKEAAQPHLAARLAERQAIAAAREERAAERERIRLAEQQRIRDEQEALAAEKEKLARAATEEREAAERSRIARVVEDEAARKAERDRRYAARKARQA